MNHSSNDHQAAKKIPKDGMQFRTIIPSLLSVALFGMAIFLIVIPVVEKGLIDAQKHLIHELVDTGIDTLQYYHGLETQGSMSREQAQAMAWGDLSRRRFGPQDKDYFWINAPDGRLLKHPYRPDMENLTVEELERKLEASALGLVGPGAAFARIIREHGHGYHRYLWQYKDQPGRVGTKLAYVKLFEPWQWVVGTGVYLDDVEAALAGLVKRLVWAGIGVVSIVLLLGFYLNLQMHRLQKDRQSTWQALSDSEAKHRAMLESAPNPIVVYDGVGKVLYINPAFTRTFGWQANELLGRRIDFVPPENKEETRKAIREAYAHPDTPYRFATRRHTRDGEVLDVIVSAAVYRDAEGTAIGMVVNIQDISQIKAVEQALLESEMTSKAIADAARDAIIMIDDRGYITFWSKSGYDILGYTADDLLGKSLHPVIAPGRFHPSYKKSMEQFQRSGEGDAVGKTIELTALHKNGDEIPVELSLASVKLKGRWHGVGILRDITERKRMIERSQKAQRLESLGTLAGGIAHDFNNLLMGIQGRTSLLLMDMQEGDPKTAHLREISEHVMSAVSLTRQLLGFARSGKYEVKATDINALIQKSADMFGRTRKEVRLRFKLASGVLTSKVDRGQIEQVLLNLYVNAWQAMPGGGDLTITTAKVKPEADVIAQHELTPGDFVQISVADNGVGMAPEVLNRIFEPFFTTKEMGRGTGLGLASSYGIIKNHGGFIAVQSEPGKGTRFDVFLPAVEGEAETIIEKKTDFEYGDETILLVDDEDMILEVGKELMIRLGYTVLTATGGAKALDVYQRHIDKIDLVIIDMIMPDMSGEQLFKSLREKNAEVKVLLSSGYGTTDTAISALVEQCSGFIQKPFALKDLSQKLREVLGGISNAA